VLGFAEDVDSLRLLERAYWALEIMGAGAAGRSGGVVAVIGVLKRCDREIGC
jgi:hypothetical protein